MEIGKLPPELLERMLGTPGAMPEGLVLGPGLGRCKKLNFQKTNSIYVIHLT